ncbi:MAG: hypothetical protein ACQESM_05750 [Bacteroidota bacterium]
MMKKFVTLLFVLVFIVGGYAQNNESNQLNIKVKDDWEDFKTVSCKEKGFMAHYFNSSKEKFIVSFYDKGLNNTWEETFRVDNDLDYLDHFYDESSGNVYLLFASGDDRPEKYILDYFTDSKIEIITIKANPKTNEDQNIINRVKHSIDIPSYNVYKQMLVSNGQLFLFLEKEKTVALVKQCFHLSHTFNAIFKKQPNHFTFLLNTEKDNDNKGIEITKEKMFYHQDAFRAENGDIIYYVHVGKSLMKSKPNLYRIDYEDGKIRYNKPVKNKETWSFRSFQPIQNSDQIIIGGFTVDEKSKVQNGLVFSYIEDGKTQDVKEISYKEAIGKENKNKDKSTFLHGRGKGNMLLEFHNKTYQMTPDGDYIIIAEQLKPKRAMGSDGGVELLGIIYKEAYLLAFDKDHNFMWQETFDMGETEFDNTKRSTRLVAKKVAEDKLQLLFPTEEKISSLTINDGEVSGRQKSLRLTSKFRKKKISSSSEINVKYWYGDYFLATGFLDVKKSDSFLSGSDEMYYVYPIKFE